MEKVGPQLKERRRRSIEIVRRDPKTSWKNKSALSLCLVDSYLFSLIFLCVYDKFIEVLSTSKRLGCAPPSNPTKESKLDILILILMGVSNMEYNSQI